MSDRRSLSVRVARLIQRFPLSWLRPFEVPLAKRGNGHGASPKIIILLALPRSGSTLTYQALIHALQPVYLSNLWNLLYALPWTGGRVASIRCSGHQSNFQSSHGFVGGLCGPAEGLRFWSYWTGCGLDEAESSRLAPEALEKRIAYLRQVIAALTMVDRPMVTGYLGHALISEQLRAWFPEAVFVRLHRDPLSNALSILRCRQAGSGGWFSVMPRECATVKGRGVHAEIAAQVYWLNRRLDPVDEDDRTVHLAYEALCTDPNIELRHVVEHCNGMGLSAALKQSLPASFPSRHAKPEDGEDADKLWRELRRLEDVHGALGNMSVTS